VPDVLVDSNVLLDVLTEDSRWYGRSAARLSAVAENNVLVINPIVYAEVSLGFARIEDVEDAMPAEFFRREPLPWEAAFLAGKCFLRYRRSGGARRAPVPDVRCAFGQPPRRRRVPELCAGERSGTARGRHRCSGVS
jgi:hypothetical protein